MPSRHSYRVEFPGGNGALLAGILDAPAEQQRIATAVFTHCFTCNKDLRAIVRISRLLADLGIAVLRYDLTGLGDSQGDFSATVFEDQIVDVRAAAEYCRSEFGRVDFLCGYSLGGAASLAAAPGLTGLKGVTTIGAPSDTVHLAELLVRMNPQIDRAGHGDVTIGGRQWTIRRALVDSLRSFDLQPYLAQLTLPVLLFHSPEDETVEYRHALNLLKALTGQNHGAAASLLSLNGADHLLTRHPSDWSLVAQCCAGWAQRLVS